MPGTGNFHFIRSTRLGRSEAVSIEGKWLWELSGSIFSRIDTLCGDGAARLFAEPTVKNQDGGDVLNVAWFGSHDDDAKDMSTLDRARLSRVEEDLARRLDALRPALADAEIGALVAGMLNVYDHNSFVAVGEHAVITNWGALPANATTSQAAYARHVEATIGRFLKSDVSPRIPGKAWTAYGTMEAASSATQAYPAAVSVFPQPSYVAAAAPAPATGTSARWLVPLVLAVFFGALFIYVAWPGNLIYEKEAPIEQSVLAQLDTANQTASNTIATLREELGKDACAIDPTLVGLPARAATNSPEGATSSGTDVQGVSK